MTELDRQTACLIIAGWCLLLLLVVLQTPFHWWFEDDTVIYAFARDTPNPLTFFVDKRGVVPGGGMGRNELAPMQSLSFWLDAWIGPRSAAVAYWHSGLSFVLAALSLFVCLCAIFTTRLQALAVTLLWTILPSTIAVNEFLSTRCYMEGFLLSCLSLGLVIQLGSGRWRQTPFTLAGLTFLLTAAVLCKEYFPTTLLAMSFLVLASYRRYAACIAVTLVGVGYGVYRAWAVGTSLEYDHIPMMRLGFSLLLAKWPYIWAGNWSSYMLLPILWVAIRSGKALPSTLPGTLFSVYGLLFVGIVVSFATIFPISAMLMVNWQSHGTWARSGFVVNTLLLVLMCKLVFTAFSRQAAQRSLIIVGASLTIGAMVTIQTWNVMKRHYDAEGHFLLEGPPGLLYSTLPASWYLPGLLKLYPEALHQTYITHKSPVDQSMADVLRQYPTLWFYQNGRVETNDGLYDRLQKESGAVNVQP